MSQSKNLCYTHRMSDLKCVTCQSTKANLICGHCQASTCKKCSHFLDEEHFIFLQPIPAELSHQCYCDHCFSEIVIPAQALYDETLEKAKNIMVFDRNQGKETRFIRRQERPFQIKNSKDQEEVTLRLAFLAAQKNYNAIIDVDIKGEKVRTGAYQTTIWSGSGVPANVKSNQLMKDRSLWQNPN